MIKSRFGANYSSDAIYPDTEAGGYTGAENCGTITPASVISTSYGYNEADLTAAYEIRQCNEYMKLGLAGTTFLYSSGDYGVAGNGGECCTKAQCAGGTYNSGSSGTFNPSFPATCPYVTAVGATQIKPNSHLLRWWIQQRLRHTQLSELCSSDLLQIPQTLLHRHAIQQLPDRARLSRRCG